LCGDAESCRAMEGLALVTDIVGIVASSLNSNPPTCRVILDWKTGESNATAVKEVEKMDGVHSGHEEEQGHS